LFSKKGGSVALFRSGVRSTGIPAATVSFKITVGIRDTIAVERWIALAKA